MRRLLPQVIAVCQTGATAYRPAWFKWAFLGAALAFATAAGSGPRVQGTEDESPLNSQVRADNNRSSLQRPIVEVREKPTRVDARVTYESEEDCD